MTAITNTTRNGIDVAQVYGTLDAIAADPSLARFEFRVSNRWITGTHSRSTIQGFHGAGQEDASRERPFTLDAGEPAVLLGHDEGANPAEALLHALAGCLTTSLVYVAAARKVPLTRVESRLEGDMDVRGCLGISDEVRNGFEQIRVTFHIEGDADEATLRGIVEQSRRRSAVYDALTQPTSVVIDVVTG